jgi:hypothetical protein
MPSRQLGASGGSVVSPLVADASVVLPLGSVSDTVVVIVVDIVPEVDVMGGVFPSSSEGQPTNGSSRAASRGKEDKLRMHSD